ncbi:zinc finger BED domain-containing protein RICESLEEPER 2 [Tanacetum coccineum]
MEMEEASNSTQMDLDNSDLELDVEKNWWKFFDTVYEEDEDGDQVKKGKCKFCSRLIAADSHTNGTPGLKNHIEKSCKKHLNRLGTNQEALICTQDWVRKLRKPINVDSLEDLFNDDEIVKDMEYELEKTSENDKGEQNVE